MIFIKAQDICFLRSEEMDCPFRAGFTDRQGIAVFSADVVNKLRHHHVY